LLEQARTIGASCFSKQIYRTHFSHSLKASDWRER
jgi:hypothetical protein